MTTFAVWAPTATRVELVHGGARLDMRPRDDGWFEIEAEAAPGDDYAFALDGGDPRPDPRSPWQPHGVHGPSRVYDHAAFAWRHTGYVAPPLADAVVYELHIGTFTQEGTFDAAIARIPDLVDLGVTAIELMPVAEFPGARGWGYDGVDLFSPHHAYGGPDALKRLVDACHGAGLAVVLDVVYNHLGPAGNYLAEFGPYFTDRYGTPWGSAVNLDDAYSDDVRRFLIDNAMTWLRDFRFDGLRLDAVHAIFDFSAVHFLEEVAAEVRALERRTGRRLWVIAESDLNDPRLVKEPDVGGYGLDAQWSDDFHHALHGVLTGEGDGYYADFGALADVATALTDAYVYAGRYSRHRKRRHGRSAAGLPGHRFLGYLQNHDQIGNRARGERSSALMSAGLLKVASSLVLCSPFVPMLFMGEEWGATTPFQYFTDHDDPDLGRAVSEGRRSEFSAFGWDPEDVPDPQAEETFARSKLDWSERDREPHRALLAWHRGLIALRRATPELRDGRMATVRADDDERWLVMERGPFAVAVNLTKDPEIVPADGDVVMASDECAPAPGGMRLAPESAAILRR